MGIGSARPSPTRSGSTRSRCSSIRRRSTSSAAQMRSSGPISGLDRHPRKPRALPRGEPGLHTLPSGPPRPRREVSMSLRMLPKLESEAALGDVERIVRDGSGATRQLAAFAESGDNSCRCSRRCRRDPVDGIAADPFSQRANEVIRSRTGGVSSPGRRGVNSYSSSSPA